MNSDDLYDRCNEDPEYLDNVLVDICSRSIILFSNHGNQTDVTRDSQTVYRNTTQLETMLTKRTFISRKPKVTNTARFSFENKHLVFKSRHSMEMGSH